jgi:ankyrin repeat protein/beta-lactamase regulating signal transducer with metallopeptidase domain
MNGISALLAQPAMQRLGWALVHFLWQGLGIALLLAAVLMLLRRRPPNARYVAACAALALMLVCPLVTFVAMSPGERQAVPRAQALRPLTAVPEPVPLAEGPADMATGGTDGQGPLLVPASPGAAPQPAWLGKLLRFRATLEAHMTWVVGLWAAGVLLLSMRLLWGWRRLRRMKRFGSETACAGWRAAAEGICRKMRVSRPVRLLESALAEAPVVVGWLRPVILVPASALTGLTPEQLAAVLAHEIAHVRRHDCLVNMLQMVVETLLFYHPAVHWASRRIRVEREHCCDDMAVAQCGDSVTYAGALAAMERLRGASVPLAVGGSDGSLLGRIKRICGAHEEQKSAYPRWLAGAVTAALVATLLVGTHVLATGSEGMSGPAASESAVQGRDQLRERLKQQVEEFFKHNFKDITSRETIEWGDAGTDEKGNHSISYKYRARIWDRDTVVLRQVFTFAPDGEFVSVQTLRSIENGTKDELIALVEDFFAHNFRDITARKTIEWGEVERTPDGNYAIRCKYEATIRDKDVLIMNQVFTFDPQGKFVKYANVEGFPQPKPAAGASEPGGPPASGYGAAGALPTAAPVAPARLNEIELGPDAILDLETARTYIREAEIGQEQFWIQVRMTGADVAWQRGEPSVIAFMSTDVVPLSNEQWDSIKLTDLALAIARRPAAIIGDRLRELVAQLRQAESDLSTSSMQERELVLELEAKKAALPQTKEMLDNLRRLVEAGRATGDELAKAELQYREATSSLIIAEMKLDELHKRLADLEAQAADLRSSITGAMLVPGAVPTRRDDLQARVLASGKDLPVTYGFRTGQGSFGVVQVTDVSTGGLKIRYKLLGPAKQQETPAQPAVEQRTTGPAAIPGGAVGRRIVPAAPSTGRGAMQDLLGTLAGAAQRPPSVATLHGAAAAGDVPAMNDLLSNGADVNASDQEGDTALHAAARAGQLESVRFLIEHDAAVDARNTTGATPLREALVQGHPAVARFLIGKGAALDVYAAAGLGEAQMVLSALEGEPGLVKARDVQGETLLHWAARGGHLDLVKELLARGAEIAARTDLGETPLYLAAYAGHLEMVSELANRGADINAADNEDHTPLIAAALGGHRALAEFLLDKGAVLEHRDKWGATALYRAAQMGHAELVRFLLDRGADIEATVPEYGRTALWRAAGEGHAAVVKLLVERGANVNARDGGGSTPLATAVRAGHQEAADILRQHGGTE